MKNKHNGRVGSYSLALFLGVAMLARAGVPGQASAAMIDLTTAGSSGEINGALYFESDAHPAGSGYGAFNAFLKINAPNSNVEQGYNTDYRYPPGHGPASVEFDQITDHHTRALALAELPRVTINGTHYLEFLLDINEPVAMNNPKKDFFLSLDELQIFIGDGPDLHDFSNDLDPSYAWADHATRIYDMDTIENDNWAKLSYWPGVGGSGWADYGVYIPEDLFLFSGQYVYLYSKFGENFFNDNNFEEWGVASQSDQQPVPEPTTIILFGTGLLGLAGTMRRKKKS